MKKIKLAFRVIIDHQSEMIWDQYVYNTTYFEYKIQHQAFDDKDPPVKNYWELLAKNKNAEKIPFLLGASINNYVEQLGGVIKSLPDVLGTTYFAFDYFKLDLIQSHIEDPLKHKIGITFFTPELLLLDIIDQKYVLSKETHINEGVETFMFAFHPQVSIVFYKNLE